MLSEMRYITSSGVVANGSYELVGAQSTENINPDCFYCDKPDDTVVRIYGAPSGVVADNDNTLLTVINTNAAMIYMPDIGVSGLSFEVAGYTAGSISVTAYYRQDI